MEPTRSISLPASKTLTAKEKFQEAFCFMFGYIAVFIVKPIRIALKTVVWVLSAGWRRLDAEDKIHAGIVRKACKRIGLDQYYPVLLNHHEPCSTCGRGVRMLVQPANDCYRCFTIDLQDNHGWILAAPGERPEFIY